MELLGYILALVALVGVVGLLIVSFVSFLGRRAELKEKMEEDDDDAEIPLEGQFYDEGQAFFVEGRLETMTDQFEKRQSHMDARTYKLNTNNQVQIAGDRDTKLWYITNLAGDFSGYDDIQSGDYLEVDGIKYTVMSIDPVYGQGGWRAICERVDDPVKLPHWKGR